MPRSWSTWSRMPSAVEPGCAEQVRAVLREVDQGMAGRYRWTTGQVKVRETPGTD